MGEMVPWSELAASKAREEEAVALAQSTHEQHREAATKLETLLSGMEEELLQLWTTLKVTVCPNVLNDWWLVAAISLCKVYWFDADCGKVHDALYWTHGMVPRADLERIRYRLTGRV